MSEAAVSMIIQIAPSWF